MGFRARGLGKFQGLGFRRFQRDLGSGVLKIWVILGGQDCSILGSILGSPYFGKLPCSASSSWHVSGIMVTMDDALQVWDKCVRLDYPRRLRLYSGLLEVMYVRKVRGGPEQRPLRLALP